MYCHFIVMWFFKCNFLLRSVFYHILLLLISMIHILKNILWHYFDIFIYIIFIFLYYFYNN